MRGHVGLIDDRRFQLGILVLTASIFSAANWLKLGTFWSDAPRSLLEIYRASSGQVPYRDFTFPYPPGAIAVSGLVMRWFGATFPVAQITFDLVSLACVLSAWVFARRLAPARTAFVATLAFTLLGATNGGNFSLFSLGVYTPAILFGAVGLLLACSGIVDMIRSGLEAPAIMFLAFGGLISCLSRPECAAALIGALLCLALIEFRAPGPLSSRFAPLLPVSAWLLVPSMCVYAFLLAWLGPGPVLAGITGYGQAAIACPWWPTGFGAVGGLAELGAAMAIGGMMALPLTTLSSRSAIGARPLYVLTVIGALLWLAYTVIFFKELTAQQSIREGFLAIAYYLVSANTFVLPIMWACCLMFIVESWCYLKKPMERTSDERIAFILLGVISVIASRDLFNTHISNTTQTSPMLYAIIIPAFPMLVRHVFSRWQMFRWGLPFELVTSRINAVAVALLCLFGCIRVVGYGVREATRHYELITTDAGPVKLADNGTSAAVYHFFKTNTAPREAIADMAYGGGINFALHRSSPFYSTQFTNFRPTAAHRQRDYVQFVASNTRFVINRDPPAVRYGTEFGCAFPRLVWKASGCADDANVVFPVLEFVRNQYRPIRQFGDLLVCARMPEDSR